MELLASLVIGLILGIILFPLSIRLQYKYNQTTKHKNNSLGGGAGGINSLWMKIQPEEQKNNVPNMGGIPIWLGLPIGLFILKIFNVLPQSFFNNPILQIFLVMFLTYGLVGFIDVLVTNLIKENATLREVQERFEIRLFRFLISTIPALITIYMYTEYMTDGFNLFQFSVIIPIMLIALAMHFAVYSAELTDGLDGLMIGIFTIINIFLLLVINFFYQEFAELWNPILSLLLGLSIIDLYLNKSPAKFFNGGPSAMPLGATMFFIAYQVGFIPIYLIASSITWIIMFSSMIQIISMKFFNKRVFKIAPLHHHFQAIGWSEKKIVYTFWGYTVVACALALILINII
jgi:phospho-N-acetylmuramoyl-pentapeptide-transferase